MLKEMIDKNSKVVMQRSSTGNSALGCCQCVHAFYRSFEAFVRQK